MGVVWGPSGRPSTWGIRMPEEVIFQIMKRSRLCSKQRQQQRPHSAQKAWTRTCHLDDGGPRHAVPRLRLMFELGLMFGPDTTASLMTLPAVALLHELKCVPQFL